MLDYTLLYNLSFGYLFEQYMQIYAGLYLVQLVLWISFQTITARKNYTLYNLSFGYPALMAASMSSKLRLDLPNRCKQADLDL